MPAEAVNVELPLANQSTDHPLLEVKLIGDLGDAEHPLTGCGFFHAHLRSVAGDDALGVPRGRLLSRCTMNRTYYVAPLDDKGREVGHIDILSVD